MTAVYPYLPFILEGFLYTCMIAVGAIVLAMTTGLVLGLLRLNRHRVVRGVTTGFVEFARGTSEVVQLYWVYFALPVLLLVQVPPVLAGILVLGVNQGAYVSEIVRGAIISVPRAQVEGAIALNLSPLARFRHVVFPQALALMLPSLGNSAVDVTKATSVVSLVTVADLTFRVQQVRTLTGESAVSYGIALLLYLALTTVISLAFGTAERRLPAGLRQSALAAGHGRSR